MPIAKSVATKDHWSQISDDDLVTIDLLTEDPEAIPGLVTEIPDGDEETFMESTYDLRGTARENFSCVHGHHRHLHGVVMKKGKARFLVGRMCAESIYGEKLDQIRADYATAFDRKSTLIRARDLKCAFLRFSLWVTDPVWETATAYYDDLRTTLATQMPFIFQTVQEYRGGKLREAAMPKYLCLPYESNPMLRRSTKDEYERLIVEVGKMTVLISGSNGAVAAKIGGIVEGLRGIVRRTNVIFLQLSDIEQFFQPATLVALCEHAQAATPHRARHYAGMLRLATKNIVVQMPTDFRIPERAAIDDLDTVLNAGK